MQQWIESNQIHSSRPWIISIRKDATYAQSLNFAIPFKHTRQRKIKKNKFHNLFFCPISCCNYLLSTFPFPQFYFNDFSFNPILFGTTHNFNTLNFTLIFSVNKNSGSAPGGLRCEPSDLKCKTDERCVVLRRFYTHRDERQSMKMYVFIFLNWLRGSNNSSSLSLSHSLTRSLDLSVWV